MGAYFYPGPDQGACTEASLFSAYHNIEHGAIYNAKVVDIRMSRMSFVDNFWGLMCQTGMEGEKLKQTLDNIHIHGEVEQLPDGLCPEYRQGLWLSGATLHDKPLHPTGASSLPISGPHEPGSWGSISTMTNIHFHDFQTKKTKCGGNQAAFGNNVGFSDYIPKASVTDVTFTNVHDDAVAYMFNPPKKWINVTDCGNFNCTGPKNVLVDIKRAVFKGSPQPNNSGANFQIISNNAGSSKFKNC